MPTLKRAVRGEAVVMRGNDLRDASGRTGSAASGARSGVWLLVGVVLVAANLRAALTGVGPLLPSIGTSTGLSGTWTGLLSTLPLLTFAATSPLVGRTAHRHGAPRALVVSLAVLAAGLVVRSLPGVFFLFAGTVVIAAAIAYGNVLLPSVIKSTVPEDRIGQVTGLYVTAMGLLAAISSGVSVPLANHLPGGWRTALACWAVLAVLAFGVWIPLYRRTGAAAATPVSRARTPGVHPWPGRSACSWGCSPSASTPRSPGCPALCMITEWERPPPGGSCSSSRSSGSSPAVRFPSLPADGRTNDSWRRLPL